MQAVLLHLAILICIYVILATSLNLLVGYTGLLSLCQAAFLGIGAYTAALVTLRLGAPLIVSLLAAALVSALSSLVIALPSLRLQGDYFFIASLGFQLIVANILLNWEGLTRGALGLYGIPRPALGGFALTHNASFLGFAVACAAVCFWFSRRLVNSPAGLVLRAIREDEVAVEALGKPLVRFKIFAFLFAAATAAIAGALYAYYFSALDPFAFTVQESVFVLSLVVVGGAGNLWGSLVGAIVLVTIPTALKFLNIPDEVAARTREIMYGLLLILMLRFRPKGFIGELQLR